MATTPSVLDQAIGRALQSPGTTQNQPGGVLDAAIARALGQNPPAAPRELTPSEQAFRPMTGNQRSPAARGGYFLPRYESPAEAQGGATQAALGTAGAAVTGSLAALAAPTVTAARVGTGVLNPAGEEILKDVTQYGPSLLRQALSNPVTQHILAKVVGYGTLGYILRRTFSGQP